MKSSRADHYMRFVFVLRELRDEDNRPMSRNELARRMGFSDGRAIHKAVNYAINCGYCIAVEDRIVFGKQTYKIMLTPETLGYFYGGGRVHSLHYAKELL